MKAMNSAPVFSNNIRSVAYDKEQHLLEITFHAGAIHQYLNVPEQEFNKLMSAEAKANYFSTFIKNKYKCRKLMIV